MNCNFRFDREQNKKSYNWSQINWDKENFKKFYRQDNVFIYYYERVTANMCIEYLKTTETLSQRKLRQNM